jgi:hypothetical protein
MVAGERRKKSACHVSSRSCIRAYSIPEPRPEERTYASRIPSLPPSFMLAGHAGR